MDFINWQINLFCSTMEKIFGVVILYHPDFQIKDNIASYLPFIEKLLVIDNSEPAAKISFDFPEDKVIIIADGENKGIAARLNQAASYAVAEGATWLLTMDQDSFFDEDNINRYRQCFDAYEGKDKVAMFGVEYEQRPQAIHCEYFETDMLITSGSLVNLGLLKKLGGFDEALFIDEVDSEYCFRANSKGFKTVKLSNVYLHHSLGIAGAYRSLKNFKKSVRTLHAPIRIYYMVRNSLYVAEKYKHNLPASFLLRRKTVLNRIKNNLLYGKEKTKLLRYIWLAYRHYKSGKMGKLML